MNERSIGSIIDEGMRKNGLSLRQTAGLAGIHHRTLLRYKRGEFRIPSETAEDLAQVFFPRSANDRRRFIIECERGEQLNDGQIAERARRKRERTMAAKKLHCHVVFFPRHGSISPVRKHTDSHGNVVLGFGGGPELHFEYQGTSVAVLIFERSGGQLFSILDDGKTSYSGPAMAGPTGDAVKQMWRYCRDVLRVGPYAALDLARREVEKSSLFDIPVNTGVVISPEDLNALQENLRAAAKARTKVDTETIIQDVIVRLDRLREQPSEILTAKKKLLRSIDNLCKRIPALQQGKL